QDIWQYFASASMPVEHKARAVIEALDHSGAPLSTQALEARVDLRRTPLELLLKVLDVDGSVRRVSGGWVATGQPWTYDSERYERVAAAREAEQQAMLDFETTSGCRMEFLQRALDDDTAQPCGRCDNCAGAWFPTDIETDAATRASRSLDRVGVEIEPRAQWPSGMDQLGVAVRGNIPVAERLAPGRALARLTDLGWGGPLREIFAPSTPDAPATPAMIAACVRVLADWPWEERPAAVVAMPSRRHPLLVESVAVALADVGRLTHLGTLTPVNGGPVGEPGGNSAYRLASVWDRFALGDVQVPAGKPVLLVDDLVDSRWTVTVASRLLRQAGASAVLPFALGVRG
ncbi:MAG: ATP-dependent helicase RecQ, partial [Microbacteriaceae bacterium]|nr:ATP-dependent helicase RecQ [Microbacteriaceae bacterium]